MAKSALIRTASFAALIAIAGTALVNLADAADRRVAPRAPVDVRSPVDAAGVPVIQVAAARQPRASFRLASANRS